MQFRYATNFQHFNYKSDVKYWLSKLKLQHLLILILQQQNKQRIYNILNQFGALLRMSFEALLEICDKVVLVEKRINFNENSSSPLAESDSHKPNVSVTLVFPHITDSQKFCLQNPFLPYI